MTMMAADPIGPSAGPAGLGIPPTQGDDPVHRAARRDDSADAGPHLVDDDPLPLARSIDLEYNQETGRWLVVVRDGPNGPVLRTVPPEELIRAIGRIRRVVGLVLDHYA